MGRRTKAEREYLTNTKGIGHINLNCILLRFIEWVQLQTNMVTVHVFHSKDALEQYLKVEKVQLRHIKLTHTINDGVEYYTLLRA